MYSAHLLRVCWVCVLVFECAQEALSLKAKAYTTDSCPQGAYSLARKLRCELVESQPATQEGSDIECVCWGTCDKVLLTFMEEGEAI